MLDTVLAKILRVLALVEGFCLTLHAFRQVRYGYFFDLGLPCLKKNFVRGFEGCFFGGRNLGIFGCQENGSEFFFGIAGEIVEKKVKLF